MDYHHGKFGDCSFSCFGFIVQTNRHTDTAKRFTPTTVVSVCNEYQIMMTDDRGTCV